MANKVINPTIYRITDALLQEKSVSHNGVVEADDGYDGLSKVMVNIPSDSGLNVNGALKLCQVNEGASVTAGDFVEFVSKYGNGEFHNTGVIADLAAVALSDTKVLVLFSDHENSQYGTAKFLTLNGTDVYVSEEMVFNEAKTSHISAAVLSENRVLVAFRDESNTYKGSALVITVDGTTISVGEKICFVEGSSSNRNYSVSSITVLALTDKKVLVTYACSYDYNVASTSDHCFAGLMTVDGTIIGVGRERLFGYSNVSAAKLSDSEVIVYYQNSSDSQSVYSRLIKIDGDYIVLGEATSLYDSYNYPHAYKAKLVTLSKNRVLLACPVGRYDNIATVVLTVENSYVHTGEPAFWGHSGNWDYLSVVALTDSKAVLSCWGTSVVLTIDGASMTFGDEITYFVDQNSASAGGYQASLAFSPNHALVLSESNIVGYYRSLYVDGTTIALQDTKAANGTFVQTTNNPTRIMGVANTSGGEGEMVEVYCVE